MLVSVAVPGHTQPGRPAIALPPVIVQAIADLNELSFGNVPAVGLTADCLNRRRRMELVRAALDTNRDGITTWGEILAGDVLGIARQLEAQLRCRAPAVEIASDDRPLLDLVSRYQASMQIGLQPILDEGFPALPLTTLESEAQRLLRHATFQRLADLVAGLDPLPSEGEMTGLDLDANVAEKAALSEAIHRLFPLVQAGVARRLRPELLALRALADGDPTVPDVITQRAGPRIVFQIDSLLSLPGARL